MRKMIKFLILILLSSYATAKDMEKEVVIALLSYKEINQYKKQVENNIKKKLGEDSIIILTSGYSFVKYNNIQIPIHINKNKYVLELNKEEIHIHCGIGF